MADEGPPAATPSRRPQLPASLRDWIYEKAVQFQYFEHGARTKEEKSLFLAGLCNKLNERHARDTGPWDERRTGEQIRNLKKERWAPLQTRDENADEAPTPVAARAQVKATPRAVATKPSNAVEALLNGWQQALLGASQLNAAALARHTANRGACNEDLVRGFLRSVLACDYLGVGTGELLDEGGGGYGSPMPRQLDVVLYNTEFPRLLPARFGSAAAAEEGCACFYRESVIAVVEVKTTLVNQDLQDVGASAALLGREVPVFVLAFDSQASLKAIEWRQLPENLRGIFALSHGSLLLSGGASAALVYPHQQPPLLELYCQLLCAIDAYARATDHERLARVCDRLQKAAGRRHHPSQQQQQQQETPPSPPPPAPVRNLSDLLGGLGLSDP